jgi:hypothetical protein
MPIGDFPAPPRLAAALPHRCCGLLARGVLVRAYREYLFEAPTGGERAFEAVSDLQRDIIGNALALRQDGWPPGRP